MSGFTSRGGAVAQSKDDWLPVELKKKTLFLHCGSAPFAQQKTRGFFKKATETKGLLLKYGKEIMTVPGTKDKKWILAFPMLDMTAHDTPNEFTLSKPAELLWSQAEMPRGFLFQLPVGTVVYTAKGELGATKEVGCNFDILFESFLIAQYKRVGKYKLVLEPLTGVSWV